MINIRVWCLTISMVLLLTACGGGGGGGSKSSVGNDESATVAVVLTDSPVEGYDQALATIRAIELIGGPEGKEPLYDGPPVMVDLLDLRDYQELFTVSENVPCGEYSKIRLWLNGLTLVSEDDSKDDVEVSLVANGKVDLNPQGTFYVSCGGTIFITIDFDMNKSVKLTLAGKEKRPKLRPVIFVHISDQKPFGRIARTRGIVDSIDEENKRFRLCEVERISQEGSYDDDLGICVMVTTGERTALFGEDGSPIDFGGLREGDLLTVIGRLLHSEKPHDGLDVEPLAAMGLDDDGWEGDWDDDHDWDYDCDAIINPRHDGEDDCDDDDDHYKGDRFGIAALVIERGGSWRIWHGETVSAVTDDQFGLELSPGQPVVIDPPGIIAVQVVDKTRYLTRRGKLLESDDLQPAQRAAVDGVLNISSDVINAALVVLAIDGDDGFDADVVTGEIVGADSITGEVIITNEDGQSCVNAEAAQIALLKITDDGIESEPGSLKDLAPGQDVLIVGKEGDGECFEAGSITVVMVED